MALRVKMAGLTIAGREVSQKKPPYLIAEISANHNGNRALAKETIQAAKECGADAVKLQTYTPDTMTINCNKKDFIVSEGTWKGYKLYDLYKEAHTPFEWHEELFRYASEIGITIFSTPFDETAVDLLNSLSVPAFKVASFELTDLPLIRYISESKKPMLISTGMSTNKEIEEVMATLRSTGLNETLLFHCISSYPASLQQSNLKKIQKLSSCFGVPVGLSDHSLDDRAAMISVALGAVAIEKHFITDRKLGGVDSSFSIEPEDFINLRRNINEVWESLGDGDLIPTNSEKQNLNYRRSIYFVKDMSAGDSISVHHIRRIRPGYGLPCKYFDKVIGLTVLKDVTAGDPLTSGCIEGFEF